MRERNTHIDELIIEYLTKRIDTDSFYELKKWVEQSSENKKYFLQQQEIWFSAISDQESFIYNKNKAFEHFKERIEKQDPVETKASRRTFHLPMFWRIATIVLVLFGSIYISYNQGVGHTKGKFADTLVEAPMGSRTKLFLPDGTLVWLNAGSSITYSQGFGVDSRKIELAGEAYFEVTKNEKVPFFVQTKSLVVRVLGTKFNFKNYPDDKEVIVSLLEGKIALNNLIRSESELTLSPNEKARLDKETGKIQLEKTKGSNAMEWTNGYLFFDEELLPDIAKKLERSYNVKVHIATDSLLTYRFYGNFIRREQEIHEVMDALSSTRRICYTIKDNEITIY